MDEVMERSQVDKYPLYSETEVRALGRIPSHWKVLRLKNVCEMIVSNVDKHSKQFEYPVRLCNYVDVYKNDFISEELTFMNATASKDEIKRFQIKLNDVLITKDSEDWKDIGVPALVKYESDDLLCGYHLAILRPRVNFIGSFLHRVFLTTYVRTQLSVKANGITRYGISHSAILDCALAIPPLHEQTAIAAFLDRKTAQIDKAIRIKERQIELLKERRQILIQNVVTKGLPAEASAKAGLEKGVKMKENGVPWIGSIPEHWEVKRLKFLLQSQGRIGFKGYTSSDQVDQGEGALTLGATHMDWEGKINLSDPVYISWKKYFESPEIMVSKNDILIVQRGSTCGKVAIVSDDLGPTTINPSLVLLKNICEEPEYIFLAIKVVLNGILSLINDTAIPMLSQFQIDNIKVPVPPRSEQLSIVRYADTIKGKINAAIDIKDKEIEKLKEYNATLINSAVTGKVRVC